MKLSGRIGRIKPSATLAINAKANELKKSGVRIINFGVGEPDFDTPQNIRNAGIESIGKGRTRYTAVGGINELKDAVCSTIRADYGLSYGRENILISSGGKHALYNLFMTLLDPGDEVIIPSPFWVSYPDMVNLANARPVVVGCSEEDGFILRPEALEKAITPKTRLLILNSPSNPTGKYYGESELKALAEVLLRHENVLIASDDIYYRILFGGRKWVSLGMVEEKLRERIFIINGVSKSYCMTGWRIGYLIGDRTVIKAATDFQSQVTSNAASISQWASVEALSGDQKPALEMAKIFEARCKRVLEIIAGLPGVTCAAPDGAFYVFPNFSAYFGKKCGTRPINGSLDLADFLMEEAHVAVVPGEAFGEDNCLRFSYALSDQEIEQGFDAVKKALQKLS
ncbi:MAG: pyridoxal phosphate-dependent aminotransferase [Syntrophobacteraceae bacterium]|nr:pyridoxal phosphate-dependent aminotransferase [Syntrophobacteraceae bacterium]